MDKKQSRFQHAIIEIFRLLGGCILLLPLHPKPAKLTHARKLYADGAIEQSIEVYFDILHKNPTCKEALDELVAHAIEIGFFDIAHKMLMETTRYYPQSVNTLLNWGFYHQRTEQYEMAAVFFQTVLKKDPNSVTAKYFLATLKETEQPEKTPIEYVEYLFDHYAYRFDEALLNLLNYRSPDNLAKLLKRHIKQPKAVLDLGCGTGLASQALKQVYPTIEHLTGVDASLGMLEKAKNKQLYQKIYHQEISDFLMSCQEKYDLIIMCDVLPYFGKLERLFQQIQTALNPEGYFCFCVEKGEHTYRLAHHGRYQHSASYIESLLPTAGLAFTSCQSQPMRSESGKPVMGLHYLLQKQANLLEGAA